MTFTSNRTIEIGDIAPRSCGTPEMAAVKAVIFRSWAGGREVSARSGNLHLDHDARQEAYLNIFAELNNSARELRCPRGNRIIPAQKIFGSPQGVGGCSSFFESVRRSTI